MYTEFDAIEIMSMTCMVSHGVSPYSNTYLHIGVAQVCTRIVIFIYYKLIT